MRLDHITPKQLFSWLVSRQDDATLTLLQNSNSDEIHPTSLLGNNSVLDPPDPIPNSEVKWNCADDSVGSPHVKVGHCQALNNEIPGSTSRVFFCLNSSEMTYLNMECDKFVWNKFEQPKAGPKGGVQDARSNVGHCQALI